MPVRSISFGATNTVSVPLGLVSEIYMCAQAKSEKRSYYATRGRSSAVISRELLSELNACLAPLRARLS